MELLRSTFLRQITALGVVGVVSIAVFLQGFFIPQDFFWDENYYLPPAQRYLNRVFFMESHPPLGKLLIAAGEALTSPNADTTQFINSDYAKDPPEGFSFVGYRLIPTLFAALSAVLLLGIFLQLSSSVFRAACFSALYLFDNALVLHSRGAMLEGIQLFFILAAILSMLRARDGHSRTLAPVLMGAFFGCAIVTKENAIFIAPILALPLLRLTTTVHRLRYILLSGIAATLSVISVWAYSFSLGQVINTNLEKGGWYEASPELKQAVLAKDYSPVALYYFIRDSLHFVHKYHSKVPQLNYCKVDENGSYPLLWPLGARAINYRWEKLSDGTTRYLFLQANPVVWGIALVGLLASIAIVAARALGMRYRAPLPHADLIYALLLSYALYIAATLSIDRVFYLYHYFIPLLLTFILAQLLFESVPAAVGASPSPLRKNLLAAMVPALSLAAFMLYKPLTYYEPISSAQFNRLRLLSLWDLIPLGSPKTNPFARPLQTQGESSPPKKSELTLGELKSVSVTQSWGTPRSGMTVDSKPLRVAGSTFKQGFGVHADSRIKFPTAGRYSRFTALAGLPDDVKGQDAEVLFKVLGDGVELWSSGPMRAGQQALTVDVDISAAQVLTLEVISSSADIDFAHACWLEPALHASSR